MICRTSTLFIAAFLLLLAACKAKTTAQKDPVSIDSLSRADKNPYITYDQSPMDMSYYPVNYPVLKMNHKDTLSLVSRVIYSRPHKKNRIIFSNAAGSLCQYGKEWRLGANEATEIDFFKNVTIDGKNVEKGRYVIYCIPHPDHWTIVLNANLDTWGLHVDTSKDILRTEIPTKVQSPLIEDFTMVFTDAAYGADLVMAWDNVNASLPVMFGK